MLRWPREAPDGNRRPNCSGIVASYVGRAAEVGGAPKFVGADLSLVGLQTAWGKRWPPNDGRTRSVVISGAPIHWGVCLRSGTWLLPFISIDDDLLATPCGPPMMILPDGLMCKLVEGSKSVKADRPFSKVISLRASEITTSTTSLFISSMLGAVDSGPV